MSTLPQIDVWEMSVTSSGDFAKHLRVEIDSSGEAALAGAADRGVGFLTERGAESGRPAAVRKQNAPTVVGVANAAIAVGGSVFAAAGGKVAPTGTVELGTALTAAGADDDLLIIVP